MLQYYALSVSHKTIHLSQLYQFLPQKDQDQIALLQQLKEQLHINEILFLNTCNRVLYFLVRHNSINEKFVQDFFSILNKEALENEKLLSSVQLMRGEEAVLHLFDLASSLESLVIGEREILHQIRDAYSLSAASHLSGEFIKLAVEQAVLAAKMVFTQTKLGNKPLSVVSLAAQQLEKNNINKDSQFIIIGAGQTIILLTKILKQKGYNNFKIFNRTLSKAQRLAHSINGMAFPIEALNQHHDFDVLIVCTSSLEPIINDELYKKMLNENKSRKILLDLAVPYNIDPEVVINNDVHYIEIEILRALAEKNLQQRKDQMHEASGLIRVQFDNFLNLYSQRLATKNISKLPQQVRQIKEYAISEVFKNKIEKLNNEDRQLLNEVIDYIEKKYINAHFIVAKEQSLN